MSGAFFTARGTFPLGYGSRWKIDLQARPAGNDVRGLELGPNGHDLPVADAARRLAVADRAGLVA